jgi:tetratricopeptide (TPR) repeat protein
MQLVIGKLGREFVDTERGGFLFRIHADENPILADRLGAAFEEDLARLKEKYGWEPPEQVLIEMFPEHDDFSVRTVGMGGLGAVGACFGPLVTLLSPRSELRGSFVWRRTALHELAHVFTLGRSRNRVPRWLTEGLSVYEERCANPTWARDQDLELLDACANGAIIPLEEFNAAFRTPRIGFAYYQGGLWAEFVAERYGFDRILAMLDAYADDAQTPDVVRTVFGKEPAVLDEEFLAYLNDTRIAGRKVQVTHSSSARRAMRERLKSAPEDASLLVDLAWAHYQAGKEVDADVYLDRALRIEPTHAAGLRLAAQRSMDRGRPDLARENLEAAFTNGGEEFYAALLLAHVCLADGDRKRSEEALRIAQRCFEPHVGPESVHLRLVDLLAADGRTEEAMQVLAHYVSIDESALAQRIDLATYELGNGDAASAHRHLVEAEQIDPFHRAIYVQQGEALRALGKPAGAIAALRSALLVDPPLEPDYTPPRSDEERAEWAQADREERADILTTIAEIEFEVGDAPAARRDLEQALRLDPDHPRAVELRELQQP